MRKINSKRSAALLLAVLMVFSLLPGRASAAVSINGTTKSPLILAHSTEKLYKFTAEYTVGAGLKDGYILGGSKLVDDTVSRAIFGLGSGNINVLN